MVQEASLREAEGSRPKVPDENEIMRNVLEPGQYLIELEAVEGRVLGQEAMLIGLNLMGWSKVCPDASEPGRARFVGETERPIAFSDTPFLRWSRISRVLALDVFGELEYRLKPIEVETGKLYELLFIARTKSHRTRDDVRKALEEMGFDTNVLSLLKKDMRVPGYPGASAGLWFGLATWRGPESYVNADDAFVFEAVEESVYHGEEEGKG